MSCKRGAFVPVIREESLRNNCCRAQGGTKFVGVPQYVLRVKNAADDPPAICLLVLEDVTEEGAVEAITEDNGDIICVDDI